MKAFSVQDNSGEGYGLIVFHETAGKARYFAMQTEWFEDSEFCDLSVTREPKADCFSTELPSAFDFCSNAEFFHSIGWVCFTSGDCDSYSCPFKKDEDEPFDNMEVKQVIAQQA